MPLQTVADFVTNPVSGIVPIDDTVIPLADWNVTGVSTPVAQLQAAVLTRDYDTIPVPWWFLWKRAATRMVR